MGLTDRSRKRSTRDDLDTGTSALKVLATMSLALVVFLLPGSFLWLPFSAWWLHRRTEKCPDQSSGMAAG